MLNPLEAIVLPRADPGVVETAGELFVDDLVDQRGLAGAGDAGDAGQGAERDLNVDALQIVLAAAEDAKLLPVSAASGRGDQNALLPAQILTRDGSGLGHQVLDAALGNDLTAVDACAGTDVHHVIRGADRILVMLHHDQRIAQIAQTAEGLQQLVVVALVQADGGLVQDIEDAHQT